MLALVSLTGIVPADPNPPPVQSASAPTAQKAEASLTEALAKEAEGDRLMAAHQPRAALCKYSEARYKLKGGQDVTHDNPDTAFELARLLIKTNDAETRQIAFRPLRASRLASSYGEILNQLNSLLQGPEAKPRWQAALASGLVKKAIVEALGSEPCEAVSTQREALAAYEKLISLDPQERRWPRELAAAHLVMGDLQLHQGNRGGAVSSYRAAFSAAETLGSGTEADCLRAVAETKRDDAGQQQSDALQLTIAPPVCASHPPSAEKTDGDWRNAWAALREVIRHNQAATEMLDADFDEQFDLLLRLSLNNGPEAPVVRQELAPMLVLAVLAFAPESEEHSIAFEPARVRQLITVLEQATALDPAMPWIRLALALAYVVNDDFERAQPILLADRDLKAARDLFSGETVRETGWPIIQWLKTRTESISHLDEAADLLRPNPAPADEEQCDDGAFIRVPL